MLSCRIANVNVTTDDSRFFNNSKKNLNRFKKKWKKNITERVWVMAARIESDEERRFPPCPAAHTLGTPKHAHELHQHYQDLFACYSALHRDHNRLVEKHKASLQAIRKQKREIQSLKLRCASPRLRNRTAADACRAGGGRKVAGRVDPSAPGGASNKENIATALGQLQTRLSSAEEELRTLKLNPCTDDGKTEVSGSSCFAGSHVLPVRSPRVMALSHRSRGSSTRSSICFKRSTTSTNPEYKRRPRR